MYPTVSVKRGGIDGDIRILPGTDKNDFWKKHKKLIRLVVLGEDLGD